MESDEVDEAELFRSIAASGARALLIGRRAMVALGLPVMTADYDLWLHRDDIEALNAALRPLDLFPNKEVVEARSTGRYVLENGERVDVLVARQVSTTDAVVVRFDDVWARREKIEYAPGVPIALPSLDDLILTKRFAARRKDLADLELLEALRRRRS